MLRRILMGAGMAYLARRFMGGRRMAPGYSRVGGSRWGRGGLGW
jgi:hypothetical protein